MKTIAAILVVTMVSTAAAQDRVALKRRLESARISVDFRNAPLASVIDYFREAGDLNIALHPSVDAELRVTLRLKDVRLRTALKLTLSGHGLGAALRDGVIIVGPRETVAPSLQTRLHDIRDLTFALQDFPGPSMEFAPVAGVLFNCCAWRLDDPEVCLNSAEWLEDLVRISTGGGWDDGPSITRMPGWLVVTQTARVQDEIASFLDRLRAMR